MKKFLIDTDISIYYLNGLHDLKTKFSSISPEKIYISEITVAEL